MSLKSSRRTFLSICSQALALLVLPRTVFAKAMKDNRQEATDCALKQLGEKLEQRYPELHTAAPAHYRKTLALRSAEDFKYGRVLELDGWILSQSEASYYIAVYKGETR